MLHVHTTEKASMLACISKHWIGVACIQIVSPAAVSMMVAAASMGADASTSTLSFGRLTENQGTSMLTDGSVKLKPADTRRTKACDRLCQGTKCC